MKALEFPEAFELNVLVREWLPMDAAFEFRCFIFDGKLTAISQVRHELRFYSRSYS